MTCVHKSKFALYISIFYRIITVLKVLRDAPRPSRDRVLPAQLPSPAPPERRDGLGVQDISGDVRDDRGWRFSIARSPRLGLDALDPPRHLLVQPPRRPLTQALEPALIRGPVASGGEGREARAG